MCTDGRQKKSKQATTRPDNKKASVIPKDVQQHCLNVFKDALWTSTDDLNTVQQVKGHLYKRDFAQAFGRPEYLRAYALRWSASRALAYAAIFEEVSEHGLDMSQLRILSLGGGAGAEVVGLAGRLATQEATTASVHVVDIAEWSEVLHQLQQSVVTPTKLSEFASAAAKAKNKALIADGFNTTFVQADMLKWTAEDTAMVLSGSQLVTLMFTLNELYSTSVAATQKLLHAITAAAEDGVFLLVVDSPGSYSTVTINGNDKRYPMQWLLDHTMLGNDEESADWVKLISEESQWFRLPDGLQYPVDLENMRYQIHLYRRRR